MEKARNPCAGNHAGGKILKVGRTPMPLASFGEDDGGNAYTLARHQKRDETRRIEKRQKTCQVTVWVRGGRAAKAHFWARLSHCIANRGRQSCCATLPGPRNLERGKKGRSQNLPGSSRPREIQQARAIHHVRSRPRFSVCYHCRIVMRIYAILALFTAPLLAAAPALMPLPVKMQTASGKLPIDANFVVETAGGANARLAPAVRSFLARVSRQTGVLY